MVEVIVVDSADQKKPQRRIRWRWIFLALFLMLLLAAGAFVVWASIPAGEIMPEALAALESNEEVVVTERGWIGFVPHDAPKPTGIIFYPGARVPAEAYAPLARRIAEEGYIAAIVYAPLNFPIFNPNAATAVIENFSAVNNWVVGGHSLGGTVAANYADNHADRVDGLFLLASYPAGNGLVDNDLRVVSLYGTNDGLTSVDDVLRSEANLPPIARFIPIEGGNHSQFGYYGLQSGDYAATISREVQVTQTVNALLALLDTLSR